MSFHFKTELARGLDALEIELDTAAYEPLEIYFRELMKWNKKVNLIAKVTSESEIVEKHFIDSLTLLPFLQKDGSHLLDIGTGGGFPGLICKTALDPLGLTLVEPRLKRVSFLRHIVRTIGLNNVEVLANRLEDEPEVMGRAFTHITCRAVTEIGPFLEMVAGFASTGAKVVCMKGPRWVEELEGARQIMEKTGFRKDAIVEHVLPKSGAQRTLLFFAGR
jgi:16S rRNA (guanine527-N7)-methyltransferase